MSLFQKAIETYDAHSAYAGAGREGRQILAPLFHSVKTPGIEIILNEDGSLDMLKAWDDVFTWTDKNGKEQSRPAKIVIPVTEESAGRTSTKIAPHPLCEQLGYLLPQEEKKYAAYTEQLSAWAASKYGHPFLQPVLAYVQGGSILNDVRRAGIKGAFDDDGAITEKAKKLLVCWKVHGIAAQEGDVPGREGCWQRPSLVRAFQEWYRSVLEEGKSEGLCMVTGQSGAVTFNHPKGVVGDYSNAKLISANDESGFSFRGRFENKEQALTVGHVASQKIHSALQWLSVEQGTKIGGRVFLCWNPQGAKIPGGDDPFEEEDAPQVDRVTPSDYRDALQKTLLGLRSRLPEQNSSVVVAVFDATNPNSGRLSVTYYNELMGSDYLQRLHDWDEHCCWYFRKGDKAKIASPYLRYIVDCAYGKLIRSKGGETWETDEKLLKKQFQILFHCRIERKHIPWDIVKALVHRASELYLYSEPSTRERILFVACAVIQKYRYDLYREECTMELESNKADRSYQYGRLMAILEKVERDTYDRGEGREPTALRLQSIFCRRPLAAAARIEGQLERAYFPRLNGASRVYYKNLIGEVMQQIHAFPEEEWNKPLKETYLMGYYLQRKQLYTKKEQNEQEVSE